MAGLRPGTCGIARDLVEHGLLEAVAGASADDFDEGATHQFRTDRERQDRRGSRAENRVASESGKQGEQWVTGPVKSPEPPQNAEERNARIAAVELAEALTRVIARGDGCLSEGIVRDDGLGVGCLVRMPRSVSRSSRSSADMIVRLLCVPRPPNRKPARSAAGGGSCGSSHPVKIIGVVAGVAGTGMKAHKVAESPSVINYSPANLPAYMSSVGSSGPLAAP